MVFTVVQVFVAIGSLVSIPDTVNYIAECFRGHMIEAHDPGQLEYQRLEGSHWIEDLTFLRR
jgi:hypothetical protein